MSSSSSLEFRHAAFHGRVGIARRDITPPVGIYSRNWGAASHDVAESIHRPLTLTAIVLGSQQDGSELVLIDADLGWWKTPETFHKFHARVLEALSIDPAKFIFALSHTHSSPPLMQPDDALPGMDLLKDWAELLFNSTVAAVREARADSFEATVDWHVGRCCLATNRDLPEPVAGSTRLVCGYNPAGAADDTLLVGRVTDAAGTLRGTLVNYACHPTTLAWQNKAISPDYIGAMREVIEAATQAPSMFLLGVCGDLAPRYQYVGETEVADAHGRELGYAALSTLSGMEPATTRLAFSKTVESGAPLAAWLREPAMASKDLRIIRTSVELPLKEWPTAAELEQQRLACTDRALEERLRRKRDIRRSVGDGVSYVLPLTVWKIGDAVLVGSCCEAYSILQQEIRRRFQGTTVICMNLINGSIGYLPPAELYDRDVYPVWQTPFDRGSLEATLESLTQGIHEILINK